MEKARPHATTRQIVEMLGGVPVVVTALGVRATAISNWHTLGFPKSKWPDLLDLAISRGIALTMSDLRAASEQARVSKSPYTPLGRRRTPQETVHAQVEKERVAGA
jgi:hypothetical protein